MTLTPEDHRVLAVWAADCAERVLGCFADACPDDGRPQQAVDVCRAWARGEASVSEARDASFAAHEAARKAAQPAARAAARAAGHAAAVAHVPGHAGRAAVYAVTAVTLAADPDQAAGATSRERDWQSGRLPSYLRAAAYPGRGAA